MNTTTYRGHAARIEYSDEDQCLVGYIAGSDDVVGFHGQSVAELRAAFEEAVDDYVETCERLDLSPQQRASDQAASDDLLLEYDLDYSKGRPNRFANRIQHPHEVHVQG